MVGTGGAGSSPGRVGPVSREKVLIILSLRSKLTILFSPVYDDPSWGYRRYGRVLYRQNSYIYLGRGTYTRLLELDAAFNMTSIEAIFASHSHQEITSLRRWGIWHISTGLTMV